MTKHKKPDGESHDEKEVVNQPANAPVVPDNVITPTSPEVLSHQYQENSPAINTNTLAYHANKGPSILDAIDTDENLEKRKGKEDEKKTVTKEEWERRTKLDVSDPAYINPSLDHFTVKG